jgi:hypothetical protein
MAQGHQGTTECMLAVAVTLALAFAGWPAFAQNLDYSDHAHIAAYADVRLEAFGKPNSRQSPISDATGGQTLPATLGLDYAF